jgi:hypothetical protein
MTQGRKLTETMIANATVPPGKPQAFLWDSQVTGFGVRLLAKRLSHEGCSKTFWFQYRPPGGVSTRMVRTGATLTPVADARKAARVLVGEIARG